ncbi:MAG TPA: SMC-Scp complex subunit ScpB [Candidatus Marinimicrobia bacterium]|jgi:segregation and condensation protein B|nr:SMC-Scp complex subunit ScpB [Candidatus Neomarinimicrobiota bacterium]
MNLSEQIQIVEALLFASPEPLTQTRINLIFETDPPKLDDTVKELNHNYEKANRSFRIQGIAGGFQLTTLPEFDIWIKRMLDKSGKLILSTAAMETLAIVAYKQPISRFNVESIRGVDCSGVIKTLLSKNLVRIKGRDEGPGRPLLYAITDKFLENFGLNRISDLPKLKEIADLTDVDAAEKMKLMELQLKPSEQPPDISPDDLATGATAQT